MSVSPNYDAVPAAMQAAPRWLVWRFIDSRKVPFSLRTGKAADPNDPETWVTFDEAVAATGFDGIGFGLGKDGFEFWSGVDLDKCRQTDGSFSPEALAIVASLNSYTEESVSGQGLHVLTKGPTGGNHVRAGLEIYDRDRYLVVTGRHLPNTPATVELRAIELNALVEREFPAASKPKRSSQALPAAIDSGDRNNQLFQEACRLRQRGASESEIAALLHAMNQERVVPPLDSREVDQIAHSATRYEPGSFETYTAGNRKDQIIPDSQFNIRLALTKLGLGLRYNDFAGVALVSHGHDEQPLDDALIHRAWLLIDERFHFRPSMEFFQIVVGDLARRNRFHPVRDYLASLQWDGTPRVPTWLTTYGGAPDTVYTRAVGSIFLIAAVRRVRMPGCKFDELLVLESEQGKSKSQALRTLCPDDNWFSDDLPLGVDAKQIIERTRGKWIIEASEMHGYSNAEVDRLKGMLSRQVDGPVRLAYGRIATEVARQFIAAGTLNKFIEYLRDSTGNRRFWPVRLQQFDLESLRRDRDQLWAEAAYAEASGVSIRLPEELWAVAAVEQEARREVDPWEERLDDAIDFSAPAVLVNDLWEALGDAGRFQKVNDAARLARILQRRGFTRKKKVDVLFNGRDDNRKRLWAWLREDADVSVLRIDRAKESSTAVPNRGELPL